MLRTAVLQGTGGGFTAHLHEDQIFPGVFAVTQACCQSVLQSTSE